MDMKEEKKTPQSMKSAPISMGKGELRFFFCVSLGFVSSVARGCQPPTTALPRVCLGSAECWDRDLTLENASDGVKGKLAREKAILS